MTWKPRSKRHVGAKTEDFTSLSAVQALEGLVTRWREEAALIWRNGTTQDAEETYRACADELTAALATLRQREDKKP